MNLEVPASSWKSDQLYHWLCSVSAHLQRGYCTMRTNGFPLRWWFYLALWSNGFVLLHKKQWVYELALTQSCLVLSCFLERPHRQCIFHPTPRIPILCCTKSNRKSDPSIPMRTLQGKHWSRMSQSLLPQNQHLKMCPETKWATNEALSNLDTWFLQWIPFNNNLSVVFSISWSFWTFF